MDKFSRHLMLNYIHYIKKKEKKIYSYVDIISISYIYIYIINYIASSKDEETPLKYSSLITD